MSDFWIQMKWMIAGDGGDVDEPVQPLPVLLSRRIQPVVDVIASSSRITNASMPDEDEPPLEDVLPDRAELAGLQRVAELIEDQIDRQVHERVGERPDAEHPADDLEAVEPEDAAERRDRQRDAAGSTSAVSPVSCSSVFVGSAPSARIVAADRISHEPSTTPGARQARKTAGLKNRQLTIAAAARDATPEPRDHQ